MARWVIVSNRLPFSLNKKTNKLTQSSGGLVTAIKGIKSSEHIHWIGSLAPGITSKHLADYPTKKDFSFSYPKIGQELYDSYYNSFCNDVLWPLLHYEKDIVKFSQEHYDNYIKVNRLFADHIVKNAKKDDVIWVNDFHLFMVPKFIKEKRPDLQVGFFLHIPFPSSEIYKELPCRKEILEHLLYADLIGFHDFSYLRHFSSAAYNILGYESSLLDIKTPIKKVRLGVYPVSIDTADFKNKAKSKATQKYIKHFNFSSKVKIILGVDRLDYTKGIPLKLQAFKKFLEQNPSYIGKVQLIQIAVPSRTDVPEYIKLRHEVERLVSEINGKYSKINYTPVKYIFNSISTFELMALYKCAHVLFVTSKRDGMNLVCLEYIVTQTTNNPGVVLLSEYAGAAQTLSHATIINPMNIDETASKLKLALEMPKPERIKRHHIMSNFLDTYTATVWAKSFINHLSQDNDHISMTHKCLDSEHSQKEMLKKVKKNMKYLFLDFDGTLAAIQEDPKSVKISNKHKSLIASLSKREDIEVIIVTGRDRLFIEKQFKGIQLYIACEHGASFYDYKVKKWRNLSASKRKPWVKDALRIFDLYTKRTPGSFVEKKQYAICWHFRNSPEDFAKLQARNLTIDLDSALKHMPVTVSNGKMIVEVKSLEANKGYFTEWFLSRYAKESDAYFIAIGDDRTDEDMFESLFLKNSYTIKVGTSQDTQAKYYLSNQKDVYSILEKI